MNKNNAKKGAMKQKINTNQQTGKKNTAAVRKPETKPSPKTEAKSTPKSTAKTAPAKAISKSEMKAAPKAETKAAPKAESKMVSKADGKNKRATSPKEILCKLIEAIRAYDETKSAGSDLLEESTHKPLFVTFNFNQSPGQSGTKPFLIDLPNRVRTDDTQDICIIVRNPQRFWKDKFETEKNELKKDMQLPMGVRIIDFDHLRKKFPTPRDRRALMNTYSAFFADERLVHLLPGQLGNHFVRAKKCPVAIPLKATKSMHEAIIPFLKKTSLLMKPGNTTAVRIGDKGLTNEQLADNAMTALNEVKKFIETMNTTLKVDETDLQAKIENADKKLPWEILSQNLHLSQSISLPIILSKL